MSDHSEIKAFVGALKKCARDMRELLEEKAE
jgi:hypothetical protein